jgi:hypothetical protein
LSVLAIMDEMADTLRAALVDPDFDIEVHARRVAVPSSALDVDVYPADPFVDNTRGAGFGDYTGQHNFIVRARLAALDHTAAQDWLLTFMDDAHDLSVTAALMDDQTLGGYASSVIVDGPSGYVEFIDPGAPTAHIGVEWRVGVLRAYS